MIKNMDVLTNLKKNIISWYPIKENQTVLQIGQDEQIYGELKNKTKNVTVIDENSITNILQKYDYVTLIGVFEKLNTEKEILEILNFAKKSIKEEGKILLAMQNKFGMQYWAGKKPLDTLNDYDTLIKNTENILSLPKIKNILDNLELKYKFYYPEPDYKTTNVIYTEEFLPDNESIDSRILTFCDEEEILNFSEREAYKQLIKEDKKMFSFFSNAFFIEIANKDNFEDIRFVSYGITRKQEYSIKTIIKTNNVLKFENNENAKSHIKQISDNIDILKKCDLKCLDRFENNGIISEYSKDAKSLDIVLVEIYEQKGLNTVIEKINEFNDQILNKLITDKIDSNYTVFEKYNINILNNLKQKLHFTSNGLYDLIFQNCLVKDEEIFIYDQEWYEENVPIEFILYRAILYFTELKKIEDINKLYKKLGLEEFIDIFELLEDKLQEKIIDSDIWSLHKNSVKDIGNLKNIFLESKKTIELSNNHIKNLENIIKANQTEMENYRNNIKEYELKVKDYKQNIENYKNNIKEYEFKVKDYKQNIEEYSINIQGLRQDINNLTVNIHEKDAMILDYANKLRTISNSFSWKITKPLRIVSWVLNPFNGASFIDRIYPPGGHRRAEYERKKEKIAKQKALNRYSKKVQGYFDLTDKETAEYWKLLDHGKNLKYEKDLEKQELNELTDYEKYIMANHIFDEELEEQIKKRFRKKPKISIVIPLYKTDTQFFRELLYTVHCQTYSRWELCLADGSPEPLVEIQKMCEKDKRIKYKFLNGENGGISDNTNIALSLATGDYIGLLDHDDFLEQNCLYEIVKCINENPNVEFIYTDEDKATSFLGDRFDAYFKSDFAPDTLLSQNYICHFSVFKKSIMDKLGGFRSEFDGAQDYDIFLRMTEIANPQNIKHIAKILYHWRMHKKSTAMEASAKPWAFKAGKRAIEDHLRRVGEDVVVKDGKAIGSYEVEYCVKGNPKVSIIIPNKDEISVLKVCLDSILEKTTYKNFEIIVVENNSTQKETFEYYEEIKKNNKIKIIYYSDKGFNYSKIINYGVKNCDGDFVIQLNNDTEIVTPNWLEKMIGYAQRKEIGAVGVRLNYPDSTIQHGGVVLGLGGIAGHLHKNIHKDAYGYFSRAIMIQNMTAVTAACIMTRREIYDEVGFMNENLAVAFNDIDFCMKIRKAGYFIIYNPYVELWHYESKSRGYEDSPEKVERFNNEIKIFQDAWGKELQLGDPYYNKNLRLDNDQYEVKTEKVE